MYKRLCFGMMLIATTAQIESALAAACPRAIGGNYTASEDIIEDTASTNCITVTGSAVVNLAGHSIICNATGAACGTAVLISSNGVTVKNGFIEPGTQSWFEGIDHSIAPTSTITNVTFDTVGIGIRDPGAKVENCVFKNISQFCILSSVNRMPTNGDIFQNYCSSADFGIAAFGPASGTPARIRRNFVIAADDTGIDTTSGGLFTVEQNIIYQGDPFIDPGVGTTLDKNLCADAGTCDVPGSNFTLSVDFVP